MPGGDRTGPLGQGPKTGGGFGNCGQNTISNNRNTGGFGLGRRGSGFGNGMGRGNGRGLGLRRRAFWGNTPDYSSPSNQQAPNYNINNEVETLQQEALHLEASLQQIKERLSQLEKQTQKNKINETE